MTNEGLMRKGWICPKCGRVYSPTTSMCAYCRGNTIKSEPTTPRRLPYCPYGGISIKEVK